MKKSTYYPLIYLSVFVNGTVALVLEILGSRILAPFYGSTIFVWTALISVALGFLALGYVLGDRIYSKNPNQHLLFLIVGLSGISTGFLYFLKRPILVYSDSFGLRYGPLCASVLFFALPFTFFGMVSPLAIKLLGFGNMAKGVVGGVFGAGTIGSLVGALLTAYVLIPSFTVSQIIWAVSGSLIILSVSGILLGSSKGNSKPLLYLIISLLLLLGPAGYLIRHSEWPPIYTLNDKDEVIYQTRDFSGDYKLLKIASAPEETLCILVDANEQGCIGPRRQISGYHGYIASVVDSLPSGSKVLILGAGLGSYLKYWQNESLYYDIVDINPDAETFLRKAGIEINLSRHQIFINDARAYLRKTENKYDLIYNDLLGNVAPVSYVYSKEFNDLAKDKLKPNGIFITHIIGKEDGTDHLVNSVVYTFNKSFPETFILSENPESFFSYVVILGINSHKTLESVNQNLAESPFGKLRPGILFTRAGLSGQLISDEINPVDYLWAKNIQENLGITDFRIKFIKLSKEDYL